MQYDYLRIIVLPAGKNAIIILTVSTNKYLVFDSATNDIWTNVNCLRWMTPSEFTGSMRIAGLGSAYEVAIIGRN